MRKIMSWMLAAIFICGATIVPLAVQHPDIPLE